MNIWGYEKRLKSARKMLAEAILKEKKKRIVESIRFGMDNLRQKINAKRKKK